MAGNANSGRKQEKPFRDALRMELAAAGEDHKALRLVAKQLINKAQGGDLSAIRELADRTDGKPTQQIGGDPENPITFTQIRLVGIEPGSHASDTEEA